MRHYQADATAPFDFVIVDEAQDISISQLKFLATLLPNKANGLFFAGDQGQRIFQQPFSWTALGIDIRGRSKGLRINYRTSHQIRTQADKLLNSELTDVDGVVEGRDGTVSVFNGPQPVIEVFDTVENETIHVGNWLKDQIESKFQPEEIGVIVRSDRELERAKVAAEYASIPLKILDKRVSSTVGAISLVTMHLAKGLEFRAVVVMACDDDIIPLQERIELAGDQSDLEEIYNTERHLLYVACTRARDKLLVTGVTPSSEFLDDLES